MPSPLSLDIWDGANLKKETKPLAKAAAPPQPEKKKAAKNPKIKNQPVGTPPKVPDLPVDFQWRVPRAQDLLDIQAAYIFHENQERRKAILEAAAQAMADTLRTASKALHSVITMLNEM